MKKLSILLAICSLLALSSCGKKSNQTHILREGKGGKKLGGAIHLNETGDLRSLDPPQINDATSRHIGENIYDQLLDFDRDLKLQPCLSAQPVLSPDGLTYTFHLR